MQRIGIDLGTTNTVAAVGDHALTIGENGSKLLPSAVAFLPNGDFVVATWNPGRIGYFTRQ